MRWHYSVQRPLDVLNFDLAAFDQEIDIVSTLLTSLSEPLAHRCLATERPRSDPSRNAPSAALQKQGVRVHHERLFRAWLCSVLYPQLQLQRHKGSRALLVDGSARPAQAYAHSYHVGGSRNGALNSVAITDKLELSPARLCLPA